ncbi:MAG: hypothetical protein GXO76_08225 [Calditrichaeota bacterium]|nr:hypothetical protein [Calditrichota bacterium]
MKNLPNHLSFFSPETGGAPGEHHHSAGKGGLAKMAYTVLGAVVTLLVVVILYLLFVKPNQGETVSVLRFSPQGSVERTTNFTVTFSKNIISESEVNKAVPQEAIYFEPNLPGKCRWIASNKLRFYPDIQLAPATSYTAIVSEKPIASHGFRLVGKRRFFFHTEPIRVVNASLVVKYLPGVRQSVNLVGTIEFNYKVDPQKAQKYIRITSGKGKKIPFRITTTSPDRVISLIVPNVPRGKKQKSIQLKVLPGLVCVGGGSGLAKTFQKPITLPGKTRLRVERVVPIRESNTQGRIRITFNIPVQLDSSQQFVSIRPAVKYRILCEGNSSLILGNFTSDTSYVLTLRKGLRAIDGSTLPQDFSTTVQFKTITIRPQLDWVGKGYYLPLGGSLNLGVSTINVRKLAIDVQKVFDNNLVYLLNSVNNLSDIYDYGWFDLKALGKEIEHFEKVVRYEKNQEVVTPISVKKYLPEGKPGIYRIIARQSSHRWNRVARWVLVTNLGILAKKASNDLYVWVNSLSDLNPVADARVTVLSRNNQIIATQTTNSEGIAVFKNFTALSEGFTPYLITVKSGEDFSFLDLKNRQLSTSDFDVGGTRMLQNGYSAFVYPERDIYRPGETVHLATIVREKEIRVPTPFPVRLRILGPDEKIVNEQQKMLNEEGAAEFQATIARYLKTGKYTALILIGEKDEIGRTTFNVEDFIPDRMKVRLTTDRDAYQTGSEMKITVDAVTLFGPPASNRRVRAKIALENADFSPKQWRGFTFRDERKSFPGDYFDFDEKRLDKNGRYVYRYHIPGNLNPPSGLRGILSATVLEPGGRGVTAYKSVLIHPADVYIGLRKVEPGYAKINSGTKMEFVVVSPDGKAIAKRPVRVEFYRIYWHSILKRVNGKYHYVSEKAESLVKKFSLVSAEKPQVFEVTPADYGKYRVVVRDSKSRVSTSVTFYASGWGYAPWAMDHPEKIEIGLDKKAYLPGDVARVQVRAPFAGRLLLTVERDGILFQKTYTLKGNTATINLPVKTSFEPNVYVSAHVIRSSLLLERNMPARAFGIAPLFVDTRAKRLAVRLTVPEKMHSKRKLTVKFHVLHTQNRPTYVTIAAVDEGICQLTDFQPPDPMNYFYGKKRLEVKSFDMYSVILPEIKSQSSPGGGMVEAARKRQISPVGVTRVKPVAFWSGLIKTDRDGRGQVTFNIPRFNGSLRVMAVAFSENKFGSQKKNVRIRDAIVLTPTFPRFVASTDSFVVPVNVFNGTEEDGAFRIELSAKGPVKVVGSKRREMHLAKGEEKAVYFDLKAKKTIGRIELYLQAQGNGAKTDRTVQIPLRPPVPFVTRSGSGTVTQDKPGEFRFPADYLPGTQSFSLTLSSFPAVQFGRSLQYLLHYPYGCVEQVTSTVFPLLYFSDLARVVEPALFRTNSADYYVNQGIARLEAMQLGNGKFSYWPGGDYVNPWGSIYASHFLIEAKKKGYDVSSRSYRLLLKALKGFARSYTNEGRANYERSAYACYVLARAHQPDRATMLYLKNNLLPELPLYSRYQLAGAFGLTGDVQTALSLLPKKFTLPTGKTRESGGNLNSPIRAQAIILTVLAEIDPSNPAIPILVKELAKEAGKNGYWPSTQDNAFALIAIAKALKQNSRSAFTGHVQINGKQMATFDSKGGHFSSKEWDGRSVRIQIKGTGKCYYYWQAQGISSRLNIPEEDNDLIARRRYLTDKGNPLVYNTIRQGDLIVAEITIKAPDESLKNVAVVDMLPAGFEIENTRLQSREGIPWIGKQNYHPAYVDVRDDRLIFYGNFHAGKLYKFYYSLRAVTAGKFILPPIHAEAMYDPQKSSVASSGSVRIIGAEE